MKTLEQAVILAGGTGERLRPLTLDLPKPMAPVNGTPFLEYLLQTIEDAGIKKVLLLLGYKAEKVIEFCEQYRRSSSVSFDYSIGAVEDLTGRRLLNAYSKLENNFLLMYGDNYWPIPLNEMWDLYRSKNVKVTTTVFSNKLGTGEYGPENNVLVGPDARVVCYDKKRATPGLSGVDIGYFIVDKSILDGPWTGNISFEEVVLPEMIKQKQLAAFMTDEQYYYITNLSSLKRFEEYIMKNQSHSTVRGS